MFGWTRKLWDNQGIYGNCSHCLTKRLFPVERTNSGFQSAIYTSCIIFPKESNNHTNVLSRRLRNRLCILELSWCGIWLGVYAYMQKLLHLRWLPFVTGSFPVSDLRSHSFSLRFLFNRRYRTSTSRSTN